MQNIFYQLAKMRKIIRICIFFFSVNEQSQIKFSLQRGNKIHRIENIDFLFVCFRSVLACVIVTLIYYSIYHLHYRASKCRTNAINAHQYAFHSRADS